MTFALSASTLIDIETAKMLYDFYTFLASEMIRPADKN